MTRPRRAMNLTDASLTVPRTAKGVTRVREIMNPSVVTVRQDAELTSLAAMLLERGISRAPVVDDDNRVVGMVGMTDLVIQGHLRGDTNEIDSAHEIPAGAGITSDGFHVHTVGNLVSDVMNRGVASVDVDSSVTEAARMLTDLHLHGAPVVDLDGTVVGFLSATDIVRWVAQEA